MKESNWDRFWQIIFVAGIILLIFAFYWTRIVKTNAEIGNNDMPYSNYRTAFQFEQEEQKIKARVMALKAEYASLLVLYKTELDRVKAFGYSDLELREKIKALKELYSDDYFQKKLDLIDEENSKLGRLLSEKCKVFCTSDDLLDAQK